MHGMDIFLSYASQDLERAKLFVSALEQQGWSVWWDRTSIPPGTNFRQVIDEAIEAARCVVVLWSKNSVKSRWVIEEAEDGNERGILVPALIDQVRVPRGFRTLQAARLVGWKGEPNHPELEKLSGAVASLLGTLATGQEEERSFPEEAARRAKEEERRRAEEAARKAKEEERRRAEEVARKEEKKRRAEEAARRAKEEERYRAEEAARKAKEEERRRAQEAARKKKEEERRQAEEAARKAKEEERRRAEEEAHKAKEEVTRRAEEAARKAKEEERRRAEAARREKVERLCRLSHSLYKAGKDERALARIVELLAMESNHAEALELKRSIEDRLEARKRAREEHQIRVLRSRTREAEQAGQRKESRQSVQPVLDRSKDNGNGSQSEVRERRLSPKAWIGIAATLVMVGVLWLLWPPGEPSNEPPDHPGETSPVGYAWVDVAPWAKIISVRDAASGIAIESVAQVVPCLLSLPPGEYEIDLANHIDPGQPLTLQFVVVSEKISDITEELPGFSYESIDLEM